jgi:trans-2,3-dihydro-3-hydroxyanthranilate isomerase
LKLKYYTLDVFTDRRFGGNPLAVFTDARAVSPELMQTIAREMNLSESVFVLPPRTAGALCRLRIFTPGMELPFAGHPTVGTGYLLALLGRAQSDAPNGTTQVVLEEEAGPVPVAIQWHDGKPGATQLSVPAMASYGPEPPPPAALAAMLSLSPEDILVGRYGPQAIRSGPLFTFVPLLDRDALSRARLKLDLWQSTLERFWAPHVFLFCRDREQPGSRIRARMFAPLMGIVEDPATGAAAAGLGAYLGVREAPADGTTQWVIEQGHEMGRPSLIRVEADTRGAEVVAVRVGGHSVLVSEGELFLDDAPR